MNAMERFNQWVYDNIEWIVLVLIVVLVVVAWMRWG